MHAWDCNHCVAKSYTTTSISMIVPRFTFFTVKFVIRCDQVTNIFRSGHDCTSTSSARNPRYFRLQADIASWVLRKVRVDTMLTPEPSSTSARDSIGYSREDLEVSLSSSAGFRRGSEGLLSSTKFGKSCNRSRCTSSRLSFFLFRISVGLCIGFPCSSSLVLPLISSAGLSVYLLTSNTESCYEDDEVGVGVVEELVGKPRTTNGSVR